jgi:hypothetical protein
LEELMTANRIMLIIKMLNLGAVIVAVSLVIWRGYILDNDVLSPVNLESKLILFCLSLAGASGLARLILEHFKVSFSSCLIAGISSVVLFLIMITISLLYLQTK